jgi:hypothetical protein
MTPVLREQSVATDAWEAYKIAFQDFAEKVSTMRQQAAKPGVGREEIEAAVLAVEKARVAYSNARNALALQLLGSPRDGVLPAGRGPSRVHTAEVAELLWESIGRPEGTAETDWYRAEEIIRLAREQTVPA